MEKSLFENKHYNFPGHAHELTFSCYRKLSYFKDEIACRIFLDNFRRAQIKFNFQIWAYVVMPNHVHALIWPCTSDYSVSKVLQVMSGTMSRRYSRLLSRINPVFHSSFVEKSKGHAAFRFWQGGGGFDRNFYENQAIHNSIRYIENNPIRAKLVRQAREYRWSSAWLTSEEEKWRPLIDRSSIPVKMIND